MAHIVSETITVTISRIVKDGAEESASLISADLVSTVEAIAQEMCGSAAIVEVA